MALAARRAILVDQLDGRLDQAARQLLRIADGGRGENELRLRTVEIRHAPEAANDIGNMRAEHAAITVHLVDDDEAQAAEELSPVGMVRQDAGVEHIGVGKDDAGLLADQGALALRCVAVINGCGNVQRWSVEVLQDRQLILRERLGRE